MILNKRILFVFAIFFTAKFLISPVWANDSSGHRHRFGLLQIADIEAEREREIKRIKWQIQWILNYLKEHPDTPTAKLTLKMLGDKLRKLEPK